MSRTDYRKQYRETCSLDRALFIASLSEGSPIGPCGHKAERFLSVNRKDARRRAMRLYRYNEFLTTQGGYKK